MIEAYFSRTERVLQDFAGILSYSIAKKAYNSEQGRISGTVILDNERHLDFAEVIDTELSAKVKYRYQVMDAKGEFVFRYDNAAHHQDIPTFPHHKHTNAGVEASAEPSLQQVLLEIIQLDRKGAQL